MRRLRALLAPLFAALLAGAVASGQEPPAPERIGDGDAPPEQGPPSQELPPASEGQEPTPSADLPTVPDPAAVVHSLPAEPALPWPLDVDALETHLRGIATAHPSFAAIEELGRSAGGRPILALRLGSGEPAERSGRPTLLLVDHLAGSAGAEAALGVARGLAEAAESDAAVQALLARASLVVAPALDPDRRTTAPAEPTLEPAVCFERNFPSGWQPETIRPGSGRMPLATPETLAAVRFLAGLKSCAIVVAFVPPAPRGTPYAGAQLPPEDRDVLARLVGALDLPGTHPVVPWHELGSLGGGFLDYAYQARGIFPLALSLPAEDELAAGGFARFAGEVAQRARLALELLPRLEVAAEGIERLASNTWQLDVRIQNAGLVPTASIQAQRRALFSDVTLALAGARLVATARRSKNGASYTDASLEERGSVSSGLLSAGEERWLRLFLEADSGASVLVSAGSPWAGGSSVQTVLP